MLMNQEIEICVAPENLIDEDLIKNLIQLKINNTPFHSFKIVKRSIDARSKNVVYRLKIEVYFEPIPPTSTESTKNKKINTKNVVYIIGAGPAGLFAALRCIALGIKPIVIEQGKCVKKRRIDVANINKHGLVNINSNYCFGEGGAGTFSDGKLYTRSDKRGNINNILQTFVRHGANPDILIDARPHIGTNKLPQIITSIRTFIENSGGEVRFETKMTDIKISFGKVTAVELNDEWYRTNTLILATGHSARDIYYLLNNKKILLEPKPFALGVRIEHPQAIIDQAQYHCNIRHPNLPPAYYSLVNQIEKRGVFSFCMCPGGIIAPCATDPNEIVVNGWSPSKRNNAFANSGTVVQINIDDIPNADKNPLALLKFQQHIEQQAFIFGGGDLKAPAQRMIDFVENKISSTLPNNSYFPGTNSSDLREILPPFIFQSLQKSLPIFGKKMKGYYTNEAILVGVESRTSSPIKIPRNRETLQHPHVEGLFPCAEGAGYAGGIVSAAIDGQLCADAVAKFLE